MRLSSLPLFAAFPGSAAASWKLPGEGVRKSPADAVQGPQVCSNYCQLLG